MRRPLRSFEEKVAATIRNPARGTAAGARVPSALPVPRQRIPRLIAGGATPPLSPPRFVGVHDSPYDLVDMMDAYLPYMEGRMTPIVVAAGISTTVVPPSGWTELATGSVGDVTYWIGWAEYSDGVTGTVFTGTTQSAICAQLLFFHDTPAGLVPTIGTAATRTAQTTHPLPSYLPDTVCPFPVLISYNVGPPQHGVSGSTAWVDDWQYGYPSTLDPVSAQWTGVDFGLWVSSWAPYDPTSLAGWSAEPGITYTAQDPLPSGAEGLTKSTITPFAALAADSVAYSLGFEWA